MGDTIESGDMLGDIIGKIILTVIVIFAVAMLGLGVYIYVMLQAL